MEFKVGDRVRIAESSEYFSTQAKLLGIGTIVKLYGDKNYRVENKEVDYTNSYYDKDLILVSSDNSLSGNNMTTKTVYKVLVVDKEDGKIEKDVTVTADNEQHAILKAFNVNAEKVFIKVTSQGSYEEYKPAKVIIDKK